MVEDLPPRLRGLLKARGGTINASLLAGPSNRGLGRTVAAVAAGSEGENRVEARSNLWRSRTEDGSRLKQIPTGLKQPLLEHASAPDSPRSM